MYLMEEKVQILMGRLDIQQYNLSLKGCLEDTMAFLVHSLSYTWSKKMLRCRWLHRAGEEE